MRRMMEEQSGVIPDMFYDVENSSTTMEQLRENNFEIKISGF